MYNDRENIKPLDKKIWLSTPTIHGEEKQYIDEAIDSNWVSTVGNNIDCIEQIMSKYMGNRYAIALSSGTAAIHLALRLAIKKVYGNNSSFDGKRVFCSDLTFVASANPVLYEKGEVIFIDSEETSWNMSPDALEKAFEMFPDVRIVIYVHLYGMPGKIDEIAKICQKKNAVLIEDAAEALGATYKNKKVGLFGDYSIISFNGNKMITGSTGGMLFVKNADDKKQIKKWSAQSKDPAIWYQHTEIGFNYGMSNIVAGIIRGQLLYLSDHIERKLVIYKRYKEAFRDIPVAMNPYESVACPNFWLSCIVIDNEALCHFNIRDCNYSYTQEHYKSCPYEIIDLLKLHNIESRPIWKPMHMQPQFSGNIIVSNNDKNCCEDIFLRGLCLPSDIKMTKGEQDIIINIVKSCFE